VQQISERRGALTQTLATLLPGADIDLAGARRGSSKYPARKVSSLPLPLLQRILTVSVQNSPESAIPCTTRLRVPVDFWRGLLGSDPPAHGLRQRLELARAVPENLHVRRDPVTGKPELISGRHLKPGTGWIEHVEIDMEPRCDDYTLSPESMLFKWYRWLADATVRVSRPIAYEHRTRQLLQSAGFIDIQETVIRVPYNSWPNDPHQKDIGRWYNLGITEGLDALSFAPLTRVYQWDLNAHVKPLLDQVRREICNRKVHAYNNM
jgi:hypothetical protein